MRPGRRSRAELKMDCLRRIGRSEVSGLRKEILVNWVESYVKLRPEEAAEFQRLLEQEDNREVETMALTWLGKAEARGKALGLEMAVEQVRREALTHLERQFGPVSEQARQKLASIRSIKRLTSLIARTPKARSIDDLGLN
jgi:succinate dehydrogenase flavin-adding protein (antitoxin of CptAB toxin-antitoxin module)